MTIRARHLIAALQAIKIEQPKAGQEHRDNETIDEVIEMVQEQYDENDTVIEFI